MTCQVITKDDAQAIWAAIEARKAKRAASMPTEADALSSMMDAYLRLKELGWNDACYCPKDGTVFDSISAGSTGIHPCLYSGEWPKGAYWVFDGGNIWPSHPILYRKQKEANDGACL